MNYDKPPKSKEEEMMEKIGTARVLEDLKRKYRSGDKEPVSNGGPSIMPEETWKHLIGRRDAFLRSLEGLPRELHVVPHNEIAGLIRIQQILDVFLKEHERDKKLSDREAFSKLVSILDAITLWETKFATECSGGASDSVPLQAYNIDTDSLYYSTKSGSTLRLKTATLQDGGSLREVIQPITEKIVFEASDGQVDETPAIGSYVREYVTSSFDNAIRSGDASKYQPGLRIYRRGDGIAAVSHIKDVRTGQESFSVDHNGDRVNKIF